MSEESTIYAAPMRSTSNPIGEHPQAPCGAAHATTAAPRVVSLTYPPSANRIWRTSGGRTYKPAEVIAWMQDCAWRSVAAGIRPTDAAVHVDVTLHPRMTAKGKSSAARIDLDNALKATLDALQGVAFKNDKQVIRLSAEVGEPVKNGGLTVKIEAL